MISIVRATQQDATLLSEIGGISYRESHGHNAPPEDVEKFIEEKYSLPAMQQDLADTANIYHILFYKQQPVGFSKIIFDAAHPAISTPQVTKLERLYLLQQFIGLQLGHSLISFNIDLARNSGQQGVWLYVWQGNERAIHFYLKYGFRIIGSVDFRISPTVSLPNHHLFLEF